MLRTKAFYILSSSVIALIGVNQSLAAQTIAEKKASMATGSVDLSKDMQDLLVNVNHERVRKHEELEQLNKQVCILYQEHASPQCYAELLERINCLKNEISQLDDHWRESACRSSRDDGYALWHQPESSLEQLVIDYGSHTHVYLIPEEIGTMKISVMSNIPIPKSAWEDMLELILSQNGIGVRQLNTYLRELYLLEPPSAAVKVITNRREDLKVFPCNSRIAFILTPESLEVQRVWFFLEKFINPTSTVAQLIGRDILLIGKPGEILDLLKIADFVGKNKGGRDYKLVPLTSVDANQMAMLLEAIFDTSAPGGQNVMPMPIPDYDPKNPNPPPQQQRISKPIGTVDSNGLQVIPIYNETQALFLIGTKEEIHKAEEVIREVEVHLADVTQKVVYWYTTKHSDPEELAEILNKVYNLMIRENVWSEVPVPVGKNNIQQESSSTASVVLPPPLPLPPPPTSQQLYHESFYQDGNVVINPRPIAPNGALPIPIVNDDRNNFIVDIKTGSIVMVVEAEYLTKLKDLIRKLDVPKKMVRIDVLLVEKKVCHKANFGLNLLKIGCPATGKNDYSCLFDCKKGHGEGIFSFMFSQARRCGIPAYDIAYNFLLSQDDVQINANPSVTTINQTPASISIQEEISINTGIFEVPVVASTALKEAFTRAQYGIKLDIIPTIHVREEFDACFVEDNVDYITLDTVVNIDTFDSVHISDRPNVTRRQIENQVLVADGQTVILGGLRRKNVEDKKEAIPFLGELPGIGKLFSNTCMADSSVEMFIFITPKIIYDPVEDQERIKMIELSKRPGDIPDFLCELEEARAYEKECLVHGSMQLLFGRQPERCICAPGEYNGR